VLGKGGAGRGRSQWFRIWILGHGQMVGEEDVLGQRAYSTTVKCHSEHGVLYSIKSSEFHRLIKANLESWSVLLKQAM